MLVGIDQVGTDVILDHLGHEPSHCPTRACDQVQHLLAARFTVQGTFDGLDLATDAANPCQELLLFANGVCHEMSMT
jgi:hypothetical protein